MNQAVKNTDRFRAGSNTALSLIGAAVILGAVNYLSMRHYARGDWTAAGIYTLSDKSVKMLGALDKDVEMYVLWSQADPRFPDIKELLDRYLAASPRLKLEVLDQDLNPERVQMIIDKYGAKMRDMGGGMLAVEASIIVVSGENVKFVSSSDFEDMGGDMLQQEPSGAQDEVSGYKAEQAISSAVLSVTSESQAKICFTQGHEEWVFEGFGGRGLGSIKQGLIQDGYKVEAITLMGSSRAPAGCEMVAVVGPQKALMEEEAALLDTFLNRGGRLLLLLDPIVEGDAFSATGLERLCAKAGIKLSQDIVLETNPARLVSSSPLSFIASEFTTHDAVAQLNLPDSVGADVKKQIGAYPVVFSMARSLVQRKGGEAVAEILAKTSEESWGEVDLQSMGSGDSVPSKDQYDTQGPAVIAMAAIVGTSEDKDKAGRLIVVGDSDFLTEDLFLNDGLANRDFWSGLVGWLSSRADLISIAPKNPEHVRLNLTEGDVGTVWQLVIGEILFFVVLGVVVWLRRRR
jgi:hypothetical protein